ncbi:alanine racemase [Candidatus Tisiphia endosymbiont of Nemotelus uliginosus]|uniref:alanine racemase n=1 Tax=Candidatus Tisiphia endosymbiont of Nemotelus uliginosus TaxID=3077926 RepID=UPI0035C8E004
MHSAHCTLEIDLAKIRANYRIMAQLCKTAEVAAVVKANSYGLGANIVAPALQQENCKSFFVTNIEEAISLRKVLGKKSNIFVLNGVFYDEVEEFKYYNFIPILNNIKQLEIWQKFAKHHMAIYPNSGLLPCAIHINTGMNRLGMTDKETKDIINNPALLEGLELQYIISHLSASEVADNPYNHKQLEKFKYYLSFFPKIKASLSNSSCVFLGEEYHFDLIRTGAALYGINPSESLINNPLHNPVRLTAPIIQLQELSAEDYIGYNMTFQTGRNSIIATLPLGYADGYSRAFSNYGEVFIDSYKAPIVGRVSMDLITIDVTDLPPEKVFLGQQVEIIGNNCTPDKIANIINTIGYEVLTMMGNRYKKVYKNDS